jgi:hypothetical protein
LVTSLPAAGNLRPIAGSRTWQHPAAVIESLSPISAGNANQTPARLAELRSI